MDELSIVRADLYDVEQAFSKSLEELDHLRAENARLREALMEIDQTAIKYQSSSPSSPLDDRSCGYREGWEDAADFARKALDEKEQA